MGEWRVQEASRLMQAGKGRPRELAAGAGAGDKGRRMPWARVGALRTEETDASFLAFLRANISCVLK